MKEIHDTILGGVIAVCFLLGMIHSRLGRIAKACEERNKP